MSWLIPGRRAHERVVGRDQVADRGVVAGRQAAVERGDVDPELLAQEVREGLRDPVRVPAQGERLHVVPGVGVEHAVQAEVDRPAVVVGGGAQVVPVEDGGLVGEDRLRGVRVVDGEPAELVVRAGGPGRRAGVRVGVIEVGVMVGGEPGSKAIPSRPRSPAESTFRWRAVHVVPSPRTSLTLPPCSRTNRRPSGANSMAVGAASPETTADSAKPAGSVVGVSLISRPSTPGRHARRPGRPFTAVEAGPVGPGV